MNVFVLKEDWNDVPAGTKIFFQDGMYYYKTATEHDRWLTPDEFEQVCDKFREQTALEFVFHCNQVNSWLTTHNKI